MSCFFECHTPRTWSEWMLSSYCAHNDLWHTYVFKTWCFSCTCAAHFENAFLFFRKKTKFWHTHVRRLRIANSSYPRILMHVPLRFAQIADSTESYSGADMHILCREARWETLLVAADIGVCLMCSRIMCQMALKISIHTLIPRAYTHVCMYVCMYIRTYVCICVCMHDKACAHSYGCVEEGILYKHPCSCAWKAGDSASRNEDMYHVNMPVANVGSTKPIFMPSPSMDTPKHY